jgi:hypothetical protein
MPEFDRTSQAAHYLIGTSAFDMHLPRVGKTLPISGDEMGRWVEVGKEQCGHSHVALPTSTFINTMWRAHSCLHKVPLNLTSLHFQYLSL